METKKILFNIIGWAIAIIAANFVTPMIMWGTPFGIGMHEICLKMLQGLKL